MNVSHQFQSQSPDCLAHECVGRFPERGEIQDGRSEADHDSQPNMKAGRWSGRNSYEVAGNPVQGPGGHGETDQINVEP